MLEILTEKIRGRRIVGVDGIPGSGKTTLADNLAKLTKRPVIHFDQYLLKQRPDQVRWGYEEWMDYKKLADEIHKLDQQPVLLEGVLFRGIMKLIDIKPDFFIYVVPKKDTRRYSFFDA